MCGKMVRIVVATAVATPTASVTLTANAIVTLAGIGCGNENGYIHKLYVGVAVRFRCGVDFIV